MSVDRLGVIERCAWWCPDCRWTASYAEPMLEVFCVRCMHEGRGAGHRCEKFVPAEQLRGAVDALRELADEVDKLRGPRSDLMAVLDAPMTLALAKARAALGGQS